MCKPIGGRLTKTQNAVEEGVVEVKWYHKEELDEEVVYPSILANIDWHTFDKDSWETEYL